MVTGTARDKARLELALRLGADQVFDISEVDPLAAVRDLTGGRGVDVVLDCTAGAGTSPILLGVEALKRREGVMVIQGELAAFPDFPVKRMTEKAITIKSARGHRFQACELALEVIASGRYPLHELGGHTFGLHEVDRAIYTLGQGLEDAIHVSVLPWGEAP
jgi:threonine dehydrogenase-like Zn-dependent dehydrogenase